VHRHPRRAFFAAATLVGLLLSACSGSATYSVAGVTFQYPHGWKTILAPATTPGSVGLTTRVGVGLDTANVVVLVVSHLSNSIGPTDTARTEQGVIQALTSSAKSHGATVQGPGGDKLGGFDGLGLTIVGLPVGGQTVDSRVIIVINGSTEYLLNCQATQDLAEQIGKGCAQVIRTFSVS
jgi:hypothetical protein